MKKILVMGVVILLMISFGTVFAVEEKELIETNTTSELIEMQSKKSEELNKYIEKYDSDSYGMTAYILNKIRFYSIPCCFIGIAIGGLYQYVLGTRRLDMKQKGFSLIISFVTILVICQVLPLIFVVVVKGF